MASMGAIQCPGRCGGTIRVYDASAEQPNAQRIHVSVDGRQMGIVYLRIDDADLRRHALCLTPHGGGEPLAVPAAA